MEQERRPRVRHKWFWITLLAIVVVTIGWYAVISGGRPSGKGAPAKPAAAKQRYHCPMHPTVISDQPGSCPICGMDLVPMEEEQPAQAVQPGQEGMAGMEGMESQPPAGASQVPGRATISLSPEKIQLIGVRTGAVEWADPEKEIRTVGIVRAAETRISNVTTKIDGWVEQLFVDYEGKTVSRGQPMLTIYSPDLVSTQQEYLLALRSRERLASSTFPEIARSGASLVEASRRRLMLWDIPASEIKRIEQSGQPLRTLTLYAPAGGVVIRKQVFPGMRITAGMPLYELADLSRIWVEASLYEYELGSVRVGNPATLTVNAYPSQEWHGRVAFIAPVLDSQTRTVKARFEFANPGMILKPGMYANVVMRIPQGRELVIPTEAVLDSGDQKIVFIARGNGRFEPRQVRLGDKVNDDRYVVESGLQAGEMVVVSGNFLIDSESQLKSSLKDMESMPAGHKHGG